MNRTALVLILCIVSAAAGWFASRAVGPGEPAGAREVHRPPTVPSPGAGGRAAGPAHPAAGAPAAGAPRPRGGAGPPAPGAGSAPPPASAAELEARAVDAQVAALEAALREMGAPEPAPGQGPPENPARNMKEEERAARLAEARRKLDPVLAAYRAAPAGPERGRLLREAVPFLQDFMAAGGGFEHLPLLEGAAEEGETAAERSAAVIALHRLWQAEAVDFLLARTRSLHAGVRIHGFEGLLWVTGEEQERALQGALPGLEDVEARVRGVVAASLPAVHRNPEHAALLLDRLRREEDPAVAEALARGVLKLDPEGGKERVARAVEGAPAAVREAVEGVLGTGK